MDNSLRASVTDGGRLWRQHKTELDGVESVTVTVNVTKVLRFLLKDRKCITESFTDDQRRPDEIKQF